MSIPTKKFIENLTASGVMTREEVTAFQRSLDTAPENGEDLAKLLIKKKKLTRFQAQRIYQGKYRGLVLGDYLILDTIGAGGMGQVYLAEHKRMGRKVALKTLPEAVAKDDQTVQRFHREVRAAAKLSHPNVVIAFDAGEASGIHFFVMEYVQGIDLAKLVRQKGQLSVNESLDFVMQSARGLQYAHEQGVVHRDIKPSNLLLTSEGVVKILDMGLALIDADEEDNPATALTTTGTLMGTMDYMSPEQALDTHTADARSDIYSLGCVLHFLLSGKPVYEGNTAVKKILAHRDQPVPSLRQARPGLPEKVDAIFQKMLAKEPDQRYQTMSQVIDELQNCSVGATAKTEVVGGTEVFRPSSSDTDSGLQRFVAGLEQASAPTILQPPGQNDSRGIDTVPSGVLQETLIGGIGEQRRKASGSSPRQRNKPWLIGSGLLGVALLLGVIVITIKNKDGTETKIEVPEGATVQIEQGNGVGQQAGNTPLPLNTNFNANDYALSFDGQDDYVEIPDLVKHLDYPFTVELTLDCKGIPDSSFDVVSVPIQDTVNEIVGYRGHWVSICRSSKRQANCESHTPLLLARKVQIAAVFDGVVPRMFVDGKEEKENWIQDVRRSELDGVFEKLIQIGRSNFHTSESKATYFNGLIDEVRISNVARYDIDFRPAKRLESDEHTIALYHFDEGEGDVLKDSSGNGHHGKIVGAKWVKLDEPAMAAQNPSAAEQQAFVDEVAKLKPEEQVEAFRQKMIEINPGYDGQLWHHVKEGNVTSLSCRSDHLRTIWPVRVFKQLQELVVGGTGPWAVLSDLSPIEGLPLKSLHVWSSDVSDLTPVQGMQLEKFGCNSTNISDLSPLAACPLKSVEMAYSPISDLSPLAGKQLETFASTGLQVVDFSALRGMPLRNLTIASMAITDLSPLQGMPLTSLNLSRTAIADISALKGLPLADLDLSETKVSDLSPLQGMPLTRLRLLHSAVADLSPLQGAPLESLNLDRCDAVSDLSPLRSLKGLKMLAIGRTGVSDLTPIEKLPIEILVMYWCPLKDISGIKDMPLKQLWTPIRAFHPEEHQFLRSLPLETLSGPWPVGMRVEEFWEQFDARRQAEIEFSESTARLPVDQQSDLVLAKLQELNKNQEIELETQVANDTVAAVKVILGEDIENITPLRAFGQLKELQIVGGRTSLDLSPVNIAPLETLTCSRMIVLRNLSILREIPTLKTINGESSTEYLDSVEAEPLGSADGM